MDLLIFHLMLQLLVFYPISLLNKLLGQHYHVLFISEALQSQAQFLKHNKYSAITGLIVQTAVSSLCVDKIIITSS